MKTMNRRSLLAFVSLAVPATALISGCATTRTGTVTTATLNVAKVKKYVKAGLNASKTVIGVLTLVPALSPYVIPIRKFAEILENSGKAFTEMAGDQITVNYDNASVRTIVDSILSAIELIVDQISVAVGIAAEAGVPENSKTMTKIQIVRDSLETVVSMFQLMVLSLLPVGVTETRTMVVPRTMMSEYSALEALGA